MLWLSCLVGKADAGMSALFRIIDNAYHVKVVIEFWSLN